MKQIGTIKQFLPVTEGDSQRGHWVMSSFVIETDEDYPVKIAFQVFGQERIDKMMKHHVGDTVQVVFTARSREYNGRWFTQLTATQIFGMTDGNTAQPPAPAPAAPPAMPPANHISVGEEEDLPF